ncbi:MAG: response regulator, partial [Deltaproteobacteria bacterium]|nr:response regulator [Deltaproteobacteria bacterium]
MINQQVAREFLEKAGLVVDIAVDGYEAVEKVKLTDYDVVLMDLQMPRMDGFEATRLIRYLDQGKDLPIIAMTAAAMKQDRQRTKSAGMNGHVAKPIDPEELIETLLAWIKPRNCAVDEVTAVSSESGDLTVPPINVPGFDMAGLLARVGGNAGALAGIFKSFEREFAGLTQDLDALMTGGAYEQAAWLIHSIKGAAGNIGATELHQTARVLENELYAGTAVSRPDFESALARVLNAITTSLDQPGKNEKKGEHDSTQISSVLQQVSMILRQYEIVSTDVMQTLSGILKELNVPNHLIDALELQVNMFD